MILHKYIPEIYDVLKDLELKISLPSELNDPFEFVVTLEEFNDSKIEKYLQNEFRERFIKETNIDPPLDINFISSQIKNSPNLVDNVIRNVKAVAEKSVRFISFSSGNSDNLKQILMWSHYSKGHCGLKLYFDSSLLTQKNTELELKKVRYSKERCCINPMKPFSEKSIGESKNLLLTKSQAWEYEEEHRLFIRPKDCFEKNNLIFFRYDPKSLIRIDLGINCAGENIIKQLDREELKHVELCKAEIDKKEFKLNYKTIN